MKGEYRNGHSTPRRARGEKGTICIRHDKLDTGACEGFFRRLKVETLRQELERVENRLLHERG